MARIKFRMLHNNFQIQISNSFFSETYLVHILIVLINVNTSELGSASVFSHSFFSVNPNCFKYQFLFNPNLALRKIKVSITPQKLFALN